MSELTEERIEELACLHHDYACGRAPGEPVIAEHCFEAKGLLRFVWAIQAETLQRAIVSFRDLCRQPETLFDDGYNAALDDFESQCKAMITAAQEGK